MDWQFRPPARVSSLSAEPFEEGERIVCFIYRSEDGEILRADLTLEESESYAVEGQLLGKWTRVVKDLKDEEREARKQALATSEEMFLSLFDTDVEPSEDQDMLKQLLALMLERKRILKSQGGVKSGIQSYMHSSSQKVYEVPMKPLGVDDIQKIESSMQALIV